MMNMKENHSKDNYTAEEQDNKKYPALIERRLKGYNTAAALFVAFGICALIATRSLYGLGFGVFIAAALFFLGFAQKKKLAGKGFENWRFEVVEHTRYTPLHRKPTGFYAKAMDGPYAGRMCHISLAGAMVTPPEGQVIELCVPEGMTASPVQDIYYIPEYYGITFQDNE